MIYAFKCDGMCGLEFQVEAKPFHPPMAPPCPKCKSDTYRLFNCQIDTSGCKDHDFIPEKSRVASNDGFGVGKAAARRREAAAQRQVQQRRKDLKGGNKGSIRQKNAVPADLYHGKIRETGDKNYWNDKKNLKRHKSTEVG